jgi:hypothetical protein
LAWAEKGWITNDSFYKWIKQVFIPYAASHAAPPARHLLLVDNHRSRFDPDMLIYARDHCLDIMVFPPNATAFMQPLDVACFGPLKALSTAAVTRHLSTRARIDMGTALEVLTTPVRDALCLENIARGFLLTGLLPIDATRIPDAKLYIPAVHGRLEEAPSAADTKAAAATAAAVPADGKAADSSLPVPRRRGLARGKRAQLLLRIETVAPRFAAMLRFDGEAEDNDEAPAAAADAGDAKRGGAAAAAAPAGEERKGEEKGEGEIEVARAGTHWLNAEGAQRAVLAAASKKKRRRKLSRRPRPLQRRLA